MARFLHATQNSVEFKMYEWLISGIFHFQNMVDHGQAKPKKAKPWVRGTTVLSFPSSPKAMNG